MALTFPNLSRSFDEARSGVRFIGYDGMFEVRFLVEAGALGKTATAEKSTLAAFDAARKSIQDVARETYSHGKKNIYILTAADFR
jgi:hypothetical protein